MPIDSIPHRLLRQAEIRPNEPAYSAKLSGEWTSFDYKTYAANSRQGAKALMALGLKKGDKTCILGFNSPDWVEFDLATMMANGAAAGIYTTCSPTEVQYIIHHSEAEIILLENDSQWQKVLAERENLPNLKHVVMMQHSEKISDDLVMSWTDFMRKGDEVSDEAFEKRMDGIGEEDLATLIYTSGTTGPPKGVMLSHRNLSWTASKAQQIAESRAPDTNLSYLPLSHIAEQMFSIHAPITTGWHVYFAESIAAVPDNLKEVQPSIVFGVPRIWEKMYAKVSAKMSGATGVKAKLLAFATHVGRQTTALRNEGKEPAGLLKLQHAIADRLIFSKIQPAMGLGNARVCVTGAAPIAKEVLEFFASLDIVIQEVYGQSEDCGPTTFNLVGRTRYGTVGPVVSDTEVKIAEDGEILVKGPHVFMGYYKDEAATNETLKDGWLYTGDLGSFDQDGFLTITGRKKEIIITAGGKNIAPKNIESALKNIGLVSQSVVIGDRRKFLSALITLDPEAMEVYAAAHNISESEAHADPDVIQAIQEGIDNHVNPLFARVEHVRKFTVLPRDFSVDDGELTPTLKIKRRVIYDHFSDEIEAMYT